MVPIKPIRLREMIEIAEIAAMKREKDETLPPDCLQFGQNWIWIAGMSAETSRFKKVN
jgi:hypothetical protein